MYRAMASHASEQWGIFGPPAVLLGSELVFTRVFMPPCQKSSCSPSRRKTKVSPGW